MLNVIFYNLGNVCGTKRVKIYSEQTEQKYNLTEIQSTSN